MPNNNPFRRAFLLAVTASVLCLSGPAAGQKDSPGRTIDRLVADRISETGAPGFAVGVSIDGKVVHAKGYGIANLETQTPVTPQTVFNIASITKTFTALAAVKLVQQGKLSLDDPLSKYLDAVPAAWRPITIRQLLSNTSGIRSFTSLSESESRCNASQDIRSYKRGDAIREVECFPLEFVPGEKWKYGDTGFYLVGMIIEKISGEDYESVLRSQILLPLGMQNTELIDYAKVVPNRAHGYSFRDGKIVNAVRFDVDEFANGGLVSTLEDMLRFEQAFLPDKVLTKSSIETMRANARLKSGEVVANYGLGLGLTPYNGQKRFGHTGGGGLGFAAAFTHFPDHRVTVVVLANADQEGIGDFANQIAKIYFKKTISQDN